MDIKRYINELEQLVALPSVSSTLHSIDQSNEAVIDWLAQQCLDRGMSVEKIAVDEAHGKYNLIATKGKGPGGLVLSGHSDTVPCNPELWQQDPWSLKRIDNRLSGLGATDMKGFFPVALAAIDRFNETELGAPVILLATADEESSMNGARALRDIGRPKARAAVIGEPTGLRAICAHKGVMMERISVVGKAGHSSNPQLGVNALEVATEVLAFLKQLNHSMKGRWHDPKFDISYPTLNLGCIHGGDSPNRICGMVDIDFDVRTIPSLDQNALTDEIVQECERIAKRTGTVISLNSLIQPVPAFDAGQSELVALCEQLTEHSAQSVAFGTEASHLQALGMDTVVMGPGSIDVAHQPNEYIELEQIAPAYEILSNLIQKYCVEHHE